MGNVGDVEIQIEGSYFVGRSPINNLYFEDNLLSKQHFVLEMTKMGCYIEDLQTKNSTFVNSVRISGRRKLTEGDVITAGREKFVFHIVRGEREVH
jgi:pSer/pThr/pTyr-binding forkhead associated (FHA) protein